MKVRGLSRAIAVVTVFAGWFVMAQTPEKFTNLKVLPKDISKRDLEATMHRFAFALGVRCEHYHVEKQASERELDFPLDDKEAKKTARVMLQMVGAINHDYISRVSKTAAGSSPIQVQCVTCHRGSTQPQPLNAVLAESMDLDGLEKTITLFHDLRKKYYGGGQYDFSETSLNQLTESLLANNKTADALAVMELNFSENHPDSAWSYHMLAMTGSRTPPRRPLGAITDRFPFQTKIVLPPPVTRLCWSAPANAGPGFRSYPRGRRKHIT